MAHTSVNQGGEEPNPERPEDPAGWSPARFPRSSANILLTDAPSCPTSPCLASYDMDSPGIRNHAVLFVDMSRHSGPVNGVLVVRGDVGECKEEFTFWGKNHS